MNARLSALLLLVTVAASAADVPPVIAPTTRAESLAQAKVMLAPKDAAAPQGLKDPFHSEAFAGAASSAGVAAPAANSGAPSGAVTRPSGPRSSRDLAAAVAEGLKPSGYLVFRGDPTLNFGQKRVKAGDSLTITFEGTEYTVVITAIKAPNFTIRLGNEEFTRPIK